MKITKLTINNLGVFRGTHVFDLLTKSSNGKSKSIILIGGKNGAGKTTLFEAVRLCLYGPNIFGTSILKRDYNKYLSDKIHTIVGSASQPSEAYIEVEFKYSHLGKEDVYVVKRLWNRTASKIVEQLEISRNGNVLDDIDIDQWQEFINELIPQGISQLFFFDGEKIQQLAEEEENNKHLRESFKSLLRLDIAERLQADIRIYIRRNSKETGMNVVEKELIEYQNEQNELEKLLDVVLQDRAQKQSNYDQITGEIERQEQKVANEGGTFASKRDDLKNKKLKLEIDIDSVKDQIREISSNLLPFAITPKYCKILRNHIAEEDKYQKFMAARELLNDTMDEVERKIKSSELWDDLTIENSTQKELFERISEIISHSKTTTDSFQDFEPLHQFSPLEKQKISMWIEQSLETVPDKLTKYSRSFEKLTRERQNVEKLLSSAPDDDVLKPLIQKLNELNMELGQLQEQMRRNDDEIRQIDYKLDDCSRRIRIQLEKIENHTGISDRLKLANKVQIVLKEYITALQKEKIKELSDAFLKCFNKLSRKGDFINKIDINIDDFSISLYDRGGNCFSKEKLSAGEKQIYAISMLWALTQTSGRPLPFIIDTPLGRLDSDHRSTLIKDFFPHASHQMIIFSTDTEIDKQYFHELTPYISKAYHIDYCNKEGNTNITKGYFWDRKEEELINGI